MMLKKLFVLKRHHLFLLVLLPTFLLLHFVFSYEFRFSRNNKNHDQDDLPLPENVPLPSEKVPLSELKYFTHDFANQGMGHKFSELLMGLHFAKNNGLQYVFNEKSFIHNFRHADLQWLADLLRQRYPVPQEIAATGPTHQEFDMHLNQWIPVINYRDTTSFAYAHSEIDLRGPLLGFGGRSSYLCPEDNPRSDKNCFWADFSFFNATRDIQDLLQYPESTTSGQRKVDQVDRLAIHIRLGDIQVSENPETYVKVIEGLRRKFNTSLPDDKIHFVYFKPSVWSLSNWWRLRAIKRVLPEAQYHNMESTEETLRFMIGSKYLMTSGSSLSFVAAYLCPNCHVISTMPKEHTDQKIKMTEDNYRKTFYYMDEWVPYIHYSS
ncbi:hypothetical protein BGZ83_000235 [Gryganskiella cystojenkinii]|nr:hypothetical protein BGZ83_000235 [Gryganskiella cystojenkinii]